MTTSLWCVLCCYLQKSCMAAFLLFGLLFRLQKCGVMVLFILRLILPLAEMRCDGAFIVRFLLFALLSRLRKCALTTFLLRGLLCRFRQCRVTVFSFCAFYCRHQKACFLPSNFVEYRLFASTHFHYAASFPACGSVMWWCFSYCGFSSHPRQCGVALFILRFALLLAKMRQDKSEYRRIASAKCGMLNKKRRYSL